MSEELIQKGLTKNGMSFGEYEYYNIGSTTIDALRRFKIVPNVAYGEFATSRPDALLVDRRDIKNIQVIAVIEYKTPEEFDTQTKKQKAVEQCVLDYCKPLGAKIGIITDGQDHIWLNPQPTGGGYHVILREDGYPLHLPFLWSSDTEKNQTLQVLRKVLLDISPVNSQLTQAQLQNPSNLADRVWQTIWLASGENPDTCLATFIEVFLFKYLTLSLQI